MAEKPQLVVQVSPEAHAAQEIAAGLDAFEKAGVGRNNNITRAGGYFIGTNGEPHDSEGNPISDDEPEAEGEDAPKAAKKKAR